MAENSEVRINRILEDAKKEPYKGRYYVYERYKSELSGLCLTAIQYEQAIIELSRILRV